MSVLHSRIRSIGDSQGQAMGAYHPYGTGATPMVMPLARVSVVPGGVAYDELAPIFAPDGEIIAATAPGSWGQLVAAGRP